MCCAKSLSYVQLFAIPSTVACEAPLSMGFSRQEYWSGFPFPPPGALCSSGMDPQRPHLFSGVGRWVPISSSRGSLQLRDGPTPPALLLWRWQVGSHFLLQGLSAAQGWSHTARTSSLAGGFFSTRASGEQTFVKKQKRKNIGCQS